MLGAVSRLGGRCRRCGTPPCVTFKNLPIPSTGGLRNQLVIRVYTLSLIVYLIGTLSLIVYLIVSLIVSLIVVCKCLLQKK